MSTEEENIEFIDAKIEPKEQRKTSFKNVLDGTVLSKDVVVRQLPFIIFLTVLAIIYIGNRYHAEKVIRQMVLLQNEIKELRSESITIASELMHISKQSEVVKLLEKNNIDLKESLEPPKIIVVEK